MTTATLTLTDFLKARIAEDAAVARKALDNDSPKSWALVFTLLDTPDGTVEMGPGRMLVECIAKRALVDEALRIESLPTGEWEEQGRGVEDGLDNALRALALPYADHPDYREEWRP